jgi:hypothetical protein
MEDEFNAFLSKNHKTKTSQDLLSLLINKDSQHNVAANTVDQTIIRASSLL